jgi:hypothetical protein
MDEIKGDIQNLYAGYQDLIPDLTHFTRNMHR